MTTAVAALGACPRHGPYHRLPYEDYVKVMRTATGPMCRQCRRELVWTIVEGRQGPGRCDARCWDSIRGACRCSCGGSQHARTFGVFERA